MIQEDHTLILPEYLNRTPQIEDKEDHWLVLHIKTKKTTGLFCISSKLPNMTKRMKFLPITFNERNVNNSHCHES